MAFKKCQCGKHPTFNMPTETKPICCQKCKTPEMINVKKNGCPCGNHPIYNVPAETKPICCRKCKTDEMINVVNKRCPCGNYPLYNVPGETTGVCCMKCKTNDMIDVKHKRCPCGTTSPVFNAPGQTKGVCCKKCKTDEMVNVINKRCPCGTTPYFNIQSQTTGVCCVRCKTPEMVDVVSKICPGYNAECPVRTRLPSKHEYCMSCDPNDARRKLFKQYEEAFFSYIKNKLDVHQREFRVSFDPNETSKKYARLDGIVFGVDIIVCLEVDENGHQDYECEEHRMHLVTAELLQIYPKHAVSWVRVNPTIDAKSQMSKTSKKIREQRFEEVVENVKDILEKRKTRVMYIGF